MALLDRFRTQPGHKNPDAAARLQFVQELPLDERDLLTEVAREDADPRVRRAAVAKLMDPAGARRAWRRPTRTSRCARRRCRCCATSRSRRSKGSARAESLAAVDAIDDAKTLVGIAKNASREATARRALARVTDGARARIDRAPCRRTKACAAPRSTGCRTTPSCSSVALNSEFKDPTLAAVERITDRGELSRLPRARRTRARPSAPARSDDGGVAWLS